MPLTLVQGSSPGAWGSTTNGATPTNGVSVTWGTGRTAGNLLLLAANGDGALTTPSGWNLAHTAQDFCLLYMYWRIADNTATDTPTIDDNFSTCIAWAEYSGNASSPVDVFNGQAANGFSGSTNYSTLTTPSTAVADELGVALWGYSSDIISGGDKFSGQTNSFVEQVDVGTNPSGQKVGLCVATRDLSVLGTYESTATINFTGGSFNGLAALITTFKTPDPVTVSRIYPKVTSFRPAPFRPGFGR